MFHGWWIVATVFMAQLFMVGFFTYGYPLLAVAVEAEFDSGMEVLSYAMIGSAMLGLGLPLVVGPLVDRWSARGLMLIGVAALTGGFLVLAWAPSVMAFVVGMSILIGGANTLLGPIVGSAAVARWFAASRGRALGIAAIGTSIGGILMPPLLGYGFASIGWRGSLRVMALALMVCVLPLLVFAFRNHPADLGLQAEGAEIGSHSGSNGPALVTSNAEILRQPSFWAVSVCLAVFLGCYSGTISNVAKFASDLGVDGTAQAVMMSTLAFSGLIGKLVFGYLADRIPLKLGLWAAIGLTTTSVALMTFEPDYPILLVAAAVMGLAAGGILPVWGALMAAIFGVANVGRSMGLQAPIISIGVMPAYWVAGRIHGMTGSFVLAFQIFAGALCVAALVLFALRMPQRDGEIRGRA
jgi:MFS family permease